MKNWLVKLFKKEYKTLNNIEILKDKLISNYKYLSSLNKRIKIAPVLKGNAYGHGLVQVARILDPLKPPFFCVDSLYEAYELLKINIQTPILIMGYTDPENFKVKKLPFSYAVFNSEMLGILNKYQPGCSIHIFVDTGMNREGIPINELHLFLKSLPKLNIVGLMSHLASSDNELQIKNFKKALETCKKYKIYPKYIHMANSDGLANFSKELDFTNMARIGLALYENVLSFKTKIIQIKYLKKGDKVGYSGTYTAKKDMKIGILPAGYNDGVDRRLSNKGYVSVEGVLCPIIGKVSMNITTIDISKVKHPSLEQEVIIYPDINYAAKICQTIPYDLLVHLGESIKRVIV